MATNTQLLSSLRLYNTFQTSNVAYIIVLQEVRANPSWKVADFGDVMWFILLRFLHLFASSINEIHYSNKAAHELMLEGGPQRNIPTGEGVGIISN